MGMNFARSALTVSLPSQNPSGQPASCRINQFKNTEPEETAVSSPRSITVFKAGQQVFHAEAGRLGVQNSACWDYLCFASGIIGASYTLMPAAARRIEALGFETVVASGLV